jgi:hypothetical protein
MAPEMLTMLGARAVGAIFVAAALMKVAAPFSFYRHLARLGVMPNAVSRALVPIAIGLEAAWGVILLTALMPHLVLPATAVGLVVMTGITVWSVKSGKTEDCGCYGGFITPSIWQSVSLNGLYILLIAAAFVSLSGSPGAVVWKSVASVLAAILFGGVAEYALRHEFRTGLSLFTPSPLKVGQRWKPAWAGSSKHFEGSSHILSYLGPDCPYCKRWVRALNVIHESPDLPNVTAVLSSSHQKVDAFLAETGVRFPVATISEAKMQRLASAVPTTVLVERGTIQDVWKGTLMSESFSSRFKAAFFPEALARAQPR